jgi:hypothetical protein
MYVFNLDFTSPLRDFTYHICTFHHLSYIKLPIILTRYSICVYHNLMTKKNLERDLPKLKTKFQKNNNNVAIS